MVVRVAPSFAARLAGALGEKPRVSVLGKRKAEAEAEADAPRGASRARADAQGRWWPQGEFERRLEAQRRLADRVLCSVPPAAGAGVVRGAAAAAAAGAVRRRIARTRRAGSTGRALRACRAVDASAAVRQGAGAGTLLGATLPPAPAAGAAAAAAASSAAEVYDPFEGFDDAPAPAPAAAVTVSPLASTFGSAAQSLGAAAAKPAGAGAAAGGGAGTRPTASFQPAGSSLFPSGGGSMPLPSGSGFSLGSGGFSAGSKSKVRASAHLLAGWLARSARKRRHVAAAHALRMPSPGKQRISDARPSILRVFFLRAAARASSMASRRCTARGGAAGSGDQPAARHSSLLREGL